VLYAMCHSHFPLFRAAYPKVAQVGGRLTEILLNRPQHEAIDMCNVCMCETIDALGLAGFDKEFNSIEAITQGQQADLLHVRLQMLLCNVCLSQKSALQLVSNCRFCLLARWSHARLP